MGNNFCDCVGGSSSNDVGPPGRGITKANSSAKSEFWNFNLNYVANGPG